VTPGDLWVAGYVTLALVCVVTVLLRREPTLLQGGTLFVFTVAYVAVAWGLLAWRGTAVPPRVLGAAVVALALAALAAPWWFVLGGPRSAVLSTMEMCFGRICAQYQRGDKGFVMLVPGGGGLHINVRELASSKLTVLSLRARPSHKKSDLFRRLLVKQYRGMLPTIRIRI
jgi:hypothetical protein